MEFPTIYPEKRFMQIPYLIDRKQMARAWKELKQTGWKDLSPEVRKWFDYNQDLESALKNHLRQHPYLYEYPDKVEECGAKAKASTSSAPQSEPERSSSAHEDSDSKLSDLVSDKPDRRDLMYTLYVLKKSREDFEALLAMVEAKKKVYHDLQVKLMDILSVIDGDDHDDNE